MIIKLIISSSLVLAGSIFHAVAAEEASLLACIQRYKGLGISPDAALLQCKDETLSSCVKDLVNKNFRATVIKDNGGKYLMDLGNDRTRWLEGGQWRQLGCDAFSKGPYYRQSDHNKNELNFIPGFRGRSFEWFRQGWCRGKIIELEQPYSLEEATLACKMGVTPPSSSSLQVSPEDDANWEESGTADPFN